MFLHALKTSPVTNDRSGSSPPSHVNKKSSQEETK